MKNIFDKAVREQIIQRIQKLTPETPRQWGTMTAAQMVAHVIDGYLMALNIRPCSDASNFFTRTIMKRAALMLPRFPRGAKIVAELDQKRKGTPPAEWTQDVQRLIDLINEVANKPEGFEWGRHPLFGKMSHKDWGRLGYLHVHHHLTQFGV